MSKQLNLKFMPISFKSINTEEEYKDFVEQFYFLADKELQRAEELKIKGEHYKLALVLAKIISIVNTVGYLRGQDNVFLDFRPHVSFQKELYQVEDEFEKRLYQLIDYIKTTESREVCKSMVEEYYLKNRKLKD